MSTLKRSDLPGEFGIPLQETAPTIIHTVKELQALDPDTLIQPLLSELSEWPQIRTATGLLAAIRVWEGPWFPAVKVAEGAQLRAARKALEEALSLIHI